MDSLSLFYSGGREFVLLRGYIVGSKATPPPQKKKMGEIFSKDKILCSPMHLPHNSIGKHCPLCPLNTPMIRDDTTSCCSCYNHHSTEERRRRGAPVAEPSQLSVGSGQVINHNSVTLQIWKTKTLCIIVRV